MESKSIYNLISVDPLSRYSLFFIYFVFLLNFSEVGNSTFTEELDEEESTAMKLADLRDFRPFPVHMVVEFLKLCSSYLVFVAFIFLLGKHTLIAAADIWLLNWKWKEPTLVYEIKQNGTVLIPKVSYSMTKGNTCSVMIIIVGNGHSNLSSNPGWGCLHLTQQ